MNNYATRRIVGLKELRENTDEFISLVQKGMRFTVVRRSRPVFSIGPAGVADDEMWEPVIDFTKIKRGGVSMTDILKRL